MLRLIDVASMHGLHVRPRDIHHAIADGNLVALGRFPLQFDEDRANAWLNALARERGVLPERTR